MAKLDIWPKRESISGVYGRVYGGSLLDHVLDPTNCKSKNSIPFPCPFPRGIGLMVSHMMPPAPSPSHLHACDSSWPGQL